MRMLALTAVVAGAIGLANGAHAQLPPSFHSGCADETTVASWCPQQILREGWTLKYEAESPKGLMDAYWRYEVWAREKLAVVCVLTGGRGGIRMNGCQELSEVHQ